MSANTPVGTPETLPSQPQKVGAIKGLSTKIAAALAAIGLAASADKVEGATILVSGLPTSGNTAISLKPSKVSGAATVMDPLTGNLNSAFADLDALTETTIDRITVTISPTDFGTGGTLTISGTLFASSDTDLSGSNGNTAALGSYQVRQEARFGLSGGPMTTINYLDSLSKSNPSTLFLNDVEQWSGTKTFSYDMPITEAGTYNLENVLMRTNVTGAAAFENFSLNFSPIPEPSTTLLAGGGLAAALLRRRRNKEDKAS